jgi:hypothetical protein
VAGQQRWSDKASCCCCSKIAEAEAAVSVNEKKWLVMHMHVQLQLDELRGPQTLGSVAAKTSLLRNKTEAYIDHLHFVSSHHFNDCLVVPLVTVHM